MPDLPPIPEGFQLEQPQVAPDALQIEPSPEAQTKLPHIPPGFQLESNYETTPQQILAGIEGGAEGVLGAAAPALEAASGLTTPQNIRNRANIDSVQHGLGQVIGLGLGSVDGVGLPALMGKVGGAARALIPGTEGVLAAEKALQLAREAGTGIESAQAALKAANAAQPLLTSVASGAVRGAIENSIFQGNDDLAKMVYGDPSATAQNAVANLGLSAAIGGGAGGLFGAVSPLWEAANSTKLGQFLDTFKRKADGSLVTPDVVSDATSKLGINVPAEIRAGLSDDPTLQESFTTLAQSDATKAGKELQGTLGQFKQDLGNSALGSLGYTPDTIPEEVSKYEAGKSIGNNLADEFEQTSKPLSDQFDTLKSKFASEPVAPDFHNNVADKIAALAEQERWGLMPDSDIMNAVGKVTKSLPNIKTLGDVNAFQSRIGELMQADPLNKPLSRAGSMVKSIVRDAEANSAEQLLGERAPELLDGYKAARQGWAEASKLKDALDERLGTRSSVGGFGKALREMSQTDGEAVLRRLSGTGDANLLELLQNKFPNTASVLRKYHLDNLVQQAASKAKAGESVSLSKLQSNVEKMSPELRGFLMPDEVQGKLSAAQALKAKLDALPWNTSNTARTLDKLWGKVPGHAMALGAALLGHSPLLGLVVEHASPLLTREAPEALRLALLKHVGSLDTDVNPAAFEKAVQYIDAARKGANAVKQAAKASLEVGSSQLVPAITDAKAKKLDSALDSQASNFDNAYLPEHAQALQALSSQAVNYLRSQRPVAQKLGALDAPQEPTEAAKAAYRRTLSIAENPLSVLEHAKSGTLTAKDVQDLNSVYPNLGAQMRQEVMNHVLQASSKGKTVPYAQRQSLSLFLGEPLDSTMQQPSMALAQSTYPQAPAPQQAPPTKKASGTAPLTKFADTYATPLQQRAREKSTT